MPLKMHQDEMPTINLTPMIDIIFQLIIFFMVGSRFTEMDKKVDVKVPQVSSASNLPTAPTRCVVSVQKTGQLSLNGNPVTLASLTTELKTLRTTKTDLNVIVRGDADAPLQNVAAALTACRNAGIADVGIAVRGRFLSQRWNEGALNAVIAAGHLPLLAAIGPDYTLQWVLLAGLSIWTVLLLSMMWTHWGQARPLLKCVILSVLAHILLILFMWGTRYLNMLPPGESLTGSVNARLVDDPGDEDLSPFVEEAPTESTVPPAPIAAPPLLAAPPPETKNEKDPSPAEPPPAPQVAQQTPAEQSPVELPMSPTADEAHSPPENVLRQPSADVVNNNLREPQPALAQPSDPPAPQYVPVSQPAATPRRAADGEAVAAPLQLRMRSDRFEVAKRYGATPDSERAVVAALAWLAANQHTDGRWIAAAHGAGREMKALGQDRQGAGQKADTGITGLALLAFLAAGQTHLEGEHREVIQKGLEFLLASQNANGSLAGEAELFAAMYCHGIATLAISEAYALTGDRRLHSAVGAAVNYTVTAQHVGGGWRYQPHDAGDLSQFGWQLMALKSAEMAGFPIPDATRVRMIRFLRTVTAGRYKGLASYRPGEQVTRPMTAEALACRFFLDIDNSPETVEEAAAFISQELPRGDRINLYYWYYGTLALFQKQDADWKRWNTALQTELLPRQRGDGQYLGSWDPDQVWGGYGGRVYSTSLACLCLEASYRYLPVYADPLGAERFTEAPGSPAIRGTR